MTLCNLTTGWTLRPALIEEWARSILGAGAFQGEDGVTVYVSGEPDDLDERIGRLEVEAAEHGDLLQVALCRSALGTLTGHKACLDALADSEWADLDARKLAVVAEGECRRVIAEAILGR